MGIGVGLEEGDTMFLVGMLVWGTPGLGGVNATGALDDVATGTAVTTSTRLMLGNVVDGLPMGDAVLSSVGRLENGGGSGAAVGLARGLRLGEDVKGLPV